MSGGRVFEVDPDGAGLPDVTLGGGSVIHVAEGPLTYAFNDYQIWPTTFTYTEAALPRPVRAKRPGEMSVASRYIQSRQTADPSRRIVVTGDFNGFEFSDGFVDVVGLISRNLDPNGAIQAGHVDLVEPNLVDQVRGLPPAERYSFTFGGSAQMLDHMLTTQNLNDYVRELQYARGDGFGDSCDIDDDNDGVLDGVDACRLSGSLPLTVIVDACDTGVTDVMLRTGCSITDSILGIANTASNHGRFVRATTRLANTLRGDDLISNKDKAAITRCAAWANVPW